VNARAWLLRRLGPLEGGQIPGGCDSCNAYQTVSPLRTGVWRITVHHDSDCKWLQARHERRAA
jgi:hypothetical protein